MTLDRVGVVMLSTVGNAVWTLPVLNAIKRARPGTRTSWIMQPGPATLVTGHPAVDEIIPFERDRGLSGYVAVRRALARRRFDALLVLQSYLKSGIVAALAHADVKLGIHRRRAHDMSWIFTNQRLADRPIGHMQDEFLSFLEPLGVPPEPVEYRLGPWPSEREWQREFFASLSRPAVAIVVGTTKAEKDWPAERCAQVCDALWHDFGLEPVLVGGRSEAERAAERVIMECTRHPPRSTVGCGLRQLVAILDGCALTVTPDTGPLHLAAALERPVISLMGYTNPKRFGPYRRYGDLVIDAYGDPGEPYDAASANRPGRMAHITERDVLERVERWRSSYGTSSGPKR